MTKVREIEKVKNSIGWVAYMVDAQKERVAEHLVNVGIGDKKQAVKEFAEKLKEKLVYVPMGVEIAIDHLITELYGGDE